MTDNWPPKTVERYELLPGACVMAYRPRRDGFAKVVIEAFDQATITLYLTEEERRAIANVIWPQDQEPQP